MRLPRRRTRQQIVVTTPLTVSEAEATADSVPFALRVSASWAWRIALVLLVAAALVWMLSFVSLLVIPLMVAALLAGLLSPVTRWLVNRRVPKGSAVALTFFGFLAVIVGALTLVGRQLVAGFAGLWSQALQGLQQVQGWLSTGPLQLSAEQINQFVHDVTNALQNNSGTIVSGALSVGSTATHIAAGALLALFALIFFLLDGDRIWRFLVGLMPGRARAAVFGAGRRGWTSMVNYVRVQMIVAFVDALGISVGAAILGVPLALPLGVLVFIGSFIPIVGALFTGLIAVLLALVANGWVNALIMLAVVLAVQEIEGHVLQPLIMGRAVSLHPLAVVLAVAGGSLLAGIAGALFSVPLLAIANTSIRYIAARGWEHDPDIRWSGGDSGGTVPPGGLSDAGGRNTAPAGANAGQGIAAPPGAQTGMAPSGTAAGRAGFPARDAAGRTVPRSGATAVVPGRDAAGRAGSAAAPPSAAPPSSIPPQAAEAAPVFEDPERENTK